MDNLQQQLPSPYILLGDLNGQYNDSSGELIENFITKNDICIMNDKSYTYLSPSTKSFTSIDLSFCHPSLFLDLLFVFVALRPMSTAMVIAGRSVHLTTLFPGQA